MRKRAILAWAILCLPLLGVAQDKPFRGNIFAGYSLLHNNSTNFNGWDGQGTFNFTPHFGVTADFSGNSKQVSGFSVLGISAGTQQHFYNFLFGPTATYYFGRSSVFTHALFGAAHSSLSAGVSVPIIGGLSAPLTSAGAFAMAFGGGVDLGLSRHFAIRAAQLDYIHTNFNATDALASGLASSTNNQQNSWRYSGGLVFRF
jgi:hypothetical protein